jgi:hypothetical protein
MSDPKDEKAALYRRIVAQTPESVLLHRMQVHGFWPVGLSLPADPPAQAAERAQLEKELAELRKAGAKVKDPEKALAAERKRRWEESKKRRAERKAKRLAAQAQRREQWDAERKAKIVHLGDGVSAGLNDTTSDGPRCRPVVCPPSTMVPPLLLLWASRWPRCAG